MFYVTVCLARLSMLPLNNCFTFIGSLYLIFLGLFSVCCDYRRCHLLVLDYVQAVCVLLILGFHTVCPGESGVDNTKQYGSTLAFNKFHMFMYVRGAASLVYLFVRLILRE